MYYLSGLLRAKFSNDRMRAAYKTCHRTSIQYGSSIYFYMCAPKRLIHNSVKYLTWTFLQKYFNSFRPFTISAKKKLYLTCLTEFWMYLCHLKGGSLELTKKMETADLITFAEGIACFMKIIFHHLQYDSNGNHYIFS